MPFDSEQYQHMDLELSVYGHMRSSDGLEYQRLGAYGDASRTFKITGKSPDSYRVQVTSKQPSSRTPVSSKDATI